jgi:diacylglycerol kinase (ATP)
MTNPAVFSVRARIASFGHALRGLVRVVASEHNAWIHAAATLIVLVLGFAFGVTRAEWIALVIVIALVWAAEAINTALEALADAVKTEFDPKIREAKDAAAGAVLICAAAAAIVGVLIFGRRLLLFFPGVLSG